MRMRVTLVALLALLVSGFGHIAAVGAAETPLSARSTDLRLVAVDLYTGGVGLFHFEGSVESGRIVEFRLPREHVPDVLKSVVVRSADGAAVPVVSYETTDQLQRRLAGTYVDLSGNPDRAAILRRLRGEEVLLRGPTRASGRIVSLEERTLEEGRRELFITLFGDEGMVDVSLADVEGIVFQEEELNREFDGLLEILRKSRIEEESTLRLHLGAEYAGPVSVSYLHAVPVWKTSYRLVLGSDGQYRLQAWGHVENTTAIPWRNVAVTLVSSRPVSFRMDLLTPLYAERPSIAPPQATALAPRTFERSLRGLAESEVAPMTADEAFGGARRAASAPAPEPTATGATATSLPTAVRYRIVAEVDLAPGLGAMLPIFDTLVPGRRVSLYRSSDGTTPRAGVEITNETGLSLLAGPVTVLEGSSFAGDSLSSDLASGETTVLTYALDTDTTVITESQSQPETVSSVRIADGMLVATRIRSLRTVYRYEHHGDGLGTLIVEHPRRPGWEIVGGLRPASESESFLRFEVPLAGIADRLEVVEEQPVSSSVALDRLSTDQIAFYLSRPVIDRETAETLRQLRTILTDLAEVDREIRSLDQEIDALFRDQERIRSNLEAVPEGSDLARRYLATLRSQEDNLEQLRESRSGLTTRQSELETRLARLIAESET